MERRSTSEPIVTTCGDLQPLIGVAFRLNTDKDWMRYDKQVVTRARIRQEKCLYVTKHSPEIMKT